MLRALIWKDYRINRLIIFAGALLFIAPLAAVSLLNAWADVRYGGPYYPWSVALEFGANLGLMLSVITLAMLGGTAFACERADRSAEFLAGLPLGRRQVILSKTLLSVVPALVLWGCGLVVLWVVAPACVTADQALAETIGDSENNLLPVLAAMSVAVFGSAWLGSSFLPSHNIATGLSFGFPILVFGIVRAVEFAVEEYELTVRWLPTVFVLLGLAGYVGGIVIYVRRLNG